MSDQIDASIKARLSRAHAKRMAPQDTLPKRASGIDPPLSSGQSRLWYLNQVEPDSAVYNLVEVNRLLGELNVSALEKAIGLSIARHEILRTSLNSEEETLVQKIAPAWDFTLHVEDVAELDPNALQDLISATIMEPFDLRVLPLFRFKLYRQGLTEHVLLFVIHHAVFDGVSVAQLLQELSRDYQRFAAEPETTVQVDVDESDSTSIQYGDYALWQQNWLASEEAAKQLQFWVDQHGGQDTPLELSTDLPRPHEQSSRGNAVRRLLPIDIISEFEHLLRQSNSSLFMGLLSLLSILLQKYTHQNGLNIGVPSSGRGHKDLEKVLGFFANTLVFHIDVDPNTSFVDHLGNVRSLCLESYGNQDIPFDRVVNAINPRRDMSQTPLYQVMLAFQDKTGAPVDFGPVRLLPFETAIRVARTDLTFWIERDHHGLSIVLEYCTDLFEHATISRLLDHMEKLLVECAANPGQPIARLNPLTSEEYLTIRANNETGIDFPTLDTLSLIEASVLAHPNRIAVISQDKQLTYAELLTQANHIAELLGKKDIRAGSTVGIYRHRSECLPAVILGIWKAGCAYLPMEPDFPIARLQYMLDKTTVACVLTDARTSLSPIGNGVTLNLDDLMQTVPFDGRHPSRTAAEPDSLAYTIFTSGSTGNPKGVMTPHRAVANFLQSMVSRPGFRDTNRMLAVATLSFDPSVMDLLLPLIVGGSVVIASKEEALDANSLMRLIREHEVDTLQATPVTWKMLLAENWKVERPFRALCGGEALSPTLARGLINAGAELWNMYGPTESTVWSTCGKIESPATPITLGQPIANAQCFVVDPDHQLCPTGVPGELCIGGFGLSKGYVGESALTEKGFIELDIPYEADLHPVYKTGDIVVRDDQGSFIYKQRNDAQIKLRGFRIESGDIEAALLEIEGIEEAAVIVKIVADADSRLLAYLRYAPGSQPAAVELRKQLGTRIPAYMIPQQFIAVASMPMTATGKVDRKALLPLGGEHETIGAYIAPATATEVRLAQIWCDALGINKISSDVVFFDAGGHSLLSISVIHQIEREFGVRLGPRDMMLNTLQQIAAMLENRQAPQKHDTVQDKGSQLNPIKCLLLKVLGR